MILIATAHDAATISNRNVASLVDGGLHPKIVGGDATRDNILAAFNNLPNHCALYLGHGDVDALTGPGRAVLFGTGDVQLLSNRLAFAIACHTATTLGPAAAQAGGTWCGFEGAINCLPDEPGLRELFSKILKFIIDEFEAMLGAGNGDVFIDRFEKLCLDTEAEILDHLDGDIYLEPLLAINLLRERLRLWEPGAVVAKQPKSASAAVSIV